jgi:molybdate transport system ATP-binding protein
MTQAVAVHLSNISTPHLQIDDWLTKPGECWAVLGRNGSGKRHLADLLCALTVPDTGTLTHAFHNIALLSFEQQQAFYEEELHNDDTDFIDRPDPGTTVAEMLGVGTALPARLAFLGLDKLLQRGYRQLSSGESRKALLAQALLQEPDLLILDEPFDSLDSASKRQLGDFFAQLLNEGGITLLFMLNTIEDIQPWHSHLAFMEKGRLLGTGTRTEILGDAAIMGLLQFDPATLPDWPEPFSTTPPPTPLVALHEGHVSYGANRIFTDIELHIRQGEHTLITGPNGSGKSTLLGLITGDHPQCYGNDLTIFGQRRGTGESIWELKRRIGIVSPALHRDHRVPGSALEIVLSGFFDSIGLYERANDMQLRHARHWLILTGLAAQAGTPFKQLSYGEQRLALIARALVKQPALLILDEPTQGLDDVNRHRVLYFLEHLCTQTQTTIVMASHRLDEHLPLFTTHLTL